MAENTFFINLVQIVGVSGLMFVVWYLYHKSSIKTFKDMLDTMAEQAKQNHEVLKEMIQTNLSTIAVLARIEQKIDSNIWCPYVKERMKEMRRDDK